MSARLNQSLGAKSARAGDAFTATVTAPITAQRGQILIPRGATLFGHISGVREPVAATDQTMIRLAFDSVMVFGRRYPLAARIDRIDAARSTANAADGIVPEGARGSAASVIADGDLDRIAGNPSFRAASGTVISLGRSDAEPILVQGSALTLRSTQPLILR